MNKSTLLTPIVGLAIAAASLGGFVVATAAHADTTTTAPTTQGTHQKPAAVGTVTAISGDSITLTDKRTSTTYTVDATNATVMKRSISTASTTTKPAAPTTVSVSDIAVGDTLMVQGTVSGDSITATKIMDGMPPMGMGGHGGHGIHGTVTAVNGTTLTVTGSDGKTYTVDSASATASKEETISVSDVAVGDSVGIDGTISGTTVTAKHIMDGVPQAPAQTASATTSS